MEIMKLRKRMTASTMLDLKILAPAPAGNSPCSMTEWD
jgi:hypothetical protein